jgi:hypothetical protein
MWGVMFPSMNSMEPVVVAVAQKKDAAEPSEGGIGETSKEQDEEVANGGVAAEQLDLEKKAMQTVKEAYSTKGKSRRASVVARAMSLEKVRVRIRARARVRVRNLATFLYVQSNSTFCLISSICRS